MDALIEFLPLLFLAVYYLLARKRKQLQQRRQQQRPQPSGEPKPPTPFEQFVAQMEDAMREAAGEPPEEKEPILVERQTAPPPPPMPVPTQRPVTATGGREREFHDLGSFKAESVFEDSLRPPHEEHGFGLDQPFSEERFERMARGLDETRHAHAPLAPRRRDTPTRTQRWRQRLADPKQAQDALVLTEIFSGPWSPRRPRGR